MSETGIVTALPAAAQPAKTAKKPKAAKGDAKNPKKPATHPPVNEMVLAAIETLKERKGSSLQAIKKYIAANYKCDVAKLSAFIRKALKTGVEKGKLIQTKGTGASGSFKLKMEEKKPKKAADEKRVKKPVGEKKVAKQAATKKPAGEKKVKTAGAKDSKKAGTVMKTATPKQKATKPSKVAAKKPRTPKPKKAAPAKKAAPKKATAKK